MDYIVDDMLDIKPLGSPYATAWIGCLFIGTYEACERFVEEVTRKETDRWQKEKCG